MNIRIGRVGMSKICLLFCLLPVLLWACHEDNQTPGEDPPQPVTPVDTLFWEMPHSQFMGLKGKVLSCVQTGSDEEGEGFEQMTMDFDSCGHLLWYDPLGLSLEEPATCEVGWIDPTTCRYEYDAKGRLIKATLAVMGDEPVVYNLEYDQHGKYVPLPFPLGMKTFFLVKDLAKVRTSGFVYTYTGGKATYATETWMGKSEITYEFKNEYPEKCTELTLRGTDTLRKDETTFIFDAKGRLQSSVLKSTYPGEEGYSQTEIQYAADFLLLPVSETSWLDGEKSVSYYYKYDAFGNLLAKSYQHFSMGESGKEVIEESNNYSGWDSQKNWTVRERQVPGLGQIFYQRQFKYRK